MGAAMLKRYQFVWSLWALYRLVVSSITWGSQAQPLFSFNNTPDTLGTESVLYLALDCTLFCVQQWHEFLLLFQVPRPQLDWDMRPRMECRQRCKSGLEAAEQ